MTNSQWYIASDQQSANSIAAHNDPYYYILAQTMDSIGDIEKVVHELKVNRDTWQAVALQYKAAFENQTKRLHELQDVCVATQAELENERVQQRQSHVVVDYSSRQQSGLIHGTEDNDNATSFGTAVIFSHPEVELDWHRRSAIGCTNPLFSHVQCFVEERNYGTALAEMERLLRGPLSSKVRAEGLLLKSNLLRAAGPGELYDALAACSEALELCNRLTELESFLPQIQYQRGILYKELHMLYRGRQAMSTASGSDSMSARASEYRRSCDDDLRVTKRRSGFDEHRTISEELMVELTERPEGKYRRTSTQIRRRAAATAERISLPRRWVTPKYEEHRENTNLS